MRFSLNVLRPTLQAVAERTKYLIHYIFIIHFNFNILFLILVQLISIPSAGIRSVKSFLMSPNSVFLLALGVLISTLAFLSCGLAFSGANSIQERDKQYI